MRKLHVLSLLAAVSLGAAVSLDRAQGSGGFGGGGSGGGAPSGAAGGDLGGTYPNPTVVSVADVSAGTLGPGNGGTGVASYAVGDLLYASGATTLARRADVAVGSVFASGGVGAAPAWSATPSLTSLTVSSGISSPASTTLPLVAGSTAEAYVKGGVATGSGTGGAGSVLGGYGANGGGNAQVIAGNATTSGPGGDILVYAGISAGTNQLGGTSTYRAGQSTGSAVGGSHVFRVSPAGGGGAGLNSYVTALTIDSTSLATFTGTVSATTFTSSNGTGREKFGSGSVTSGDNATVVGSGGAASAGSVGIGNAVVAGTNGVVLGNQASSQGGGDRTGCIVAGDGCIASADYSILFGYQGASSVANSFGAGSPTGYVSTISFGDGYAACNSPHATTYQLATPNLAANGAGVNATLRPGAGKGSGIGGSLVVQTTNQEGAGGGQQTYYDRLLVNGKAFAGSTTTNTADAYCILGCPVADSGVSCVVDFTIVLADGSHHTSTLSGTQWVGVSNRNGTLAAVSSTFAASNNGTGADTTTFSNFTTTTTVSASGTNVSLTVTPTWSAGTPTSCTIYYQVRANGPATLTPQ